MKLAYSFTNQLSPEKLLSDIKKLVAKIPRNELQNHLLVMDIVKISNYDGDSPIPKITYDPDSLT